MGPKPNTNPFGRRLPAVEPVPSPYPVPVVMIILAFMTLVYYVIRRMRSRAPKKALSDRVISSACPCRRQPAKPRAITPLRHVVVVRITETKPKGGCNSFPSYPTVGRYYARKSP